jgi:hypothetical protein
VNPSENFAAEALPLTVLSPPVGVLAVVAWSETGFDKLFSPDLFSCTSRIPPALLDLH